MHGRELLDTLQKLIKVKEEVAKKLEVARANKEIGLSQEAQVTLFAEGDELEFLTGKEALYFSRNRYAFKDGDTARQIVFSVLEGSATTRFVVIGSRPLATHSTDA